MEQKLEGFKILNYYHDDYLNQKNILENFKKIMDEIKYKGFVILFISKDTFKSYFFWEEVKIALYKDVRIIPVLLDNDINISDYPILKYFAFFKYENIDKLYYDIYTHIRGEFNRELAILENLYR